MRRRSRISFAVRARRESRRRRPCVRSDAVCAGDLHTTTTAVSARAVAEIVESGATTLLWSLRRSEANRQWCDHSILLAGVLRSPALSLPARQESARQSEILHVARRHIFLEGL